MSRLSVCLTMRLLTLLPLLALTSFAAAWSAPSPSLSLNKYEQEVFDVAMQIGDWSWEPSTGWIEVDDDGVRFRSSHHQSKDDQCLYCRTYERKYFMSGSQWVKLSDGKRPEHGTSSVCYIGTKPTPSGVSRTCGWRSRRLLALTAAQPIVAVLECRSERYGVAR